MAIWDKEPTFENELAKFWIEKGLTKAIRAPFLNGKEGLKNITAWVVYEKKEDAYNYILTDHSVKENGEIIYSSERFEDVCGHIDILRCACKF